MFAIDKVYGDWNLARITLTRAEAKHVIAELTRRLQEAS